MKNKSAIAVFISLVIIQISFCSYLIYRHETILRNENQLKLAIEPIDPADPLRGKYINLRFKGEDLPLQPELKLKYGQRAYVNYTTDNNGFIKFNKISLNKPDENYIKIRIRYADDKNIHMELPFRRYYIMEDKAPEAESAYFRAARGDKADAYVVIRVKSGNVVIENLYIENMPIDEFIRKHKKG